MEKWGIDISSWQSTLSLFNLTVKPDFVIVRIGGGDGKNQDGVYEDLSFRRFYMEAKTLNIPCGGYWYLSADNITKQKEFLLNILKATQFEYPIYLDVEDTPLLKKNKPELTDLCVRFLDDIEKQGYYVGIYGSASTFKYNLYVSDLRRFDSWIAKYSKEKPETETDMPYSIWQNGTTLLSGYTGQVDNNIQYSKFDYADIMKRNHLNNFK